MSKEHQSYPLFLSADSSDIEKRVLDRYCRFGIAYGVASSLACVAIAGHIDPPIAGLAIMPEALRQACLLIRDVKIEKNTRLQESRDHMAKRQEE